MYATDFDQLAVQLKTVFDWDFIVTLFSELQNPFDDVSSILGIAREDRFDECGQWIHAVHTVSKFYGKGVSLPYPIITGFLR